MIVIDISGIITVPKLIRNHSMGEKNSLCDSIRACIKCFMTIPRDRKHTCDEIFCNICHKHQPSNHRCFIQPDSGKANKDDFLFIFYDLETRQEKINPDGSALHEPNLCVFKQRCNVCIASDVVLCVKCGMRVQIYRCQDPISPFIHHILQLRKEFKTVVVLAHNGSKFDHQFILNYFLSRTTLKPEVIMRGTQIILLKFENVRFLDSLNYFRMTLSKLPRAFGLGEELKKGYFPHLSNTTNNENYVGSLPRVEYYSPETMKKDERKTFLEWYEKHKNEEFVMQGELVEYCIADVDISTKACLKFRDQLLTTTNVCPFIEATTIASACNKVFRRNFLNSNSIGVIPKNGYRHSDEQSKIALQWLIWEEHCRNIVINHADRWKETVLQGFKVDGNCLQTNTIFEFQGYETTIFKTDHLRSLGYEVVEKRECDFRKELQSNQEIVSYTKHHPMISYSPLDPRQAFMGGSTGNTKSYYKVKSGEKLNM
ncbi:hypothetical protein JTB14_037402 [Gonioctena quinquepunctata]|nr:hypothetical protein JTB14_037402 [Gonioctena quinquepunctata]